MSSQGRIGLVVATLVVLVIAFVALSPGGDDDEPTQASTTPAAPAAPTGTTAGTATTDTPPAPPAPTFETIRVRAGKPVGGVKTITVDKGDRVRIEVTSPDTSDEIHLHGYDRYRDLKAGGKVRFAFDANAEGVFEIELHRTGTQIGKLVVEP